MDDDEIIGQFSEGEDTGMGIIAGELSITKIFSGRHGLLHQLCSIPRTTTLESLPRCPQPGRKEME